MRLFIYPYDYRNQFLLSCIGRKHEIEGVFTRENWKYDHERVEAKGIRVFKTLQTAEYLEQCDGILFYWNELMKTSDLRGCMLENIKLCLGGSKQAYCMLPLDKDEIQELEDLALAHNTQFHYMWKQEESLEPMGYTQELSACDVPVIYIGELCEGVGGRELTAGIAAGLESRGYKVCGILDDACAEFIGIHATPGFIRREMQEEEKVIRFNHHIKRLEKELKPDIFVIQIPGSIHQFSDKLFSGFGIYCFYYSHAFCPDMFFCTVPGNMSEEALIRRIDQNMEISYGYGMDAVWKTSVYIDPYEAFEIGILDLSYQVKKDDLPKTYQAGDLSVVQGGSEMIYGIFCDLIEDTLSKETIAIL